MKKLLLTSLLFSISLCASAETIRFATEATYPPFGSSDASGKIVSFDIDLANTLAKTRQNGTWQVIYNQWFQK